MHWSSRAPVFLFQVGGRQPASPSVDPRSGDDAVSHSAPSTHVYGPALNRRACLWGKVSRSEVPSVRLLVHQGCGPQIRAHPRGMQLLEVPQSRILPCFGYWWALRFCCVGLWGKGPLFQCPWAGCSYTPSCSSLPRRLPVLAHGCSPGVALGSWESRREALNAEQKTEC